MLAGELAETARDIINDRPLPYFAGVIAARLLSVLADPLHNMYDKVNRFLNRGPQWTPTKLPSYWVDKIILHPPKDDNGHYQEIEWLLDALIDGLRTPAVRVSLHCSHDHLYSCQCRIWRFIATVTYLSDCYRYLHRPQCPSLASKNLSHSSSAAHTQMEDQRLLRAVVS